jgi:endogenous inhibitor of DNA gyrase (YacG/DUF329 family)
MTRKKPPNPASPASSGDQDSGRPCPICGKPTREAEHRPFCSARCSRIDLHRWLGEVYRVPGPPLPPDGSEAPGAPPEDETEC